MSRTNDRTADPVLILAPIGSKGSVLAAALGRHPGLFAAPHLNLLAFDTVRQFTDFAKAPRDLNIHGLVRLLSWLLIGEQSLEAAQAANRWLSRHGSMGTSVLHRLLSDRLHPQRLVEYSPLYCCRRAALERVLVAMPNAVFIHLVRHPAATAMEIARAAAQTTNAVIRRWMNHEPDQPTLDILELTDTTIDWQSDPPAFDPQFLWYRTHTWIAAALARIPRRQVIQMRTEDLLAEPQAALARICRHLQLPVTSEILSGMLRIEEDRFSRPGPYGTAGGVDWDFVAQPSFPQLEPLPSLAGDLPWRGDGRGFRPEVIALAEELGYRSSGHLARAALDWGISANSRSQVVDAL